MTPRRFLLSALVALAASLVAVVAVTLPAIAGTNSHMGAAVKAVQSAQAKTSIASEASVVQPRLVADGTGYFRDGAAPTLPSGSRLDGALAPTTPLTGDISLVPQDPAALAQLATDVSTPGSSDYRHYMSARRFATRYGATPAAISAVRSALSAAGLTVGATSPNRLDIKISGSAARFERAFATSLQSYHLANGRIAFANTSAPRIAASAARYVSAVVGLDDLDAFAPQGLSAATHAPAAGLPGIGGAATSAATTTTTGATTTTSSLLGSSAVGTPTTVTTTTPATAASYANGPTPCASAQAFAAAGSEPSGLLGSGVLEGEDYNYDAFAKAYDFEPLYRAGDLGQGVNVAIFELEANYATDTPQFDNCYGIDTNINYVPVDNGGGAASGSAGEETALDIDTITALAPDANVTVYQGDGDSAWLDTFNAIVSADDDQVVSVSYGVCELLASTYVGSTPQADLPVFEEAALQGQTFVASSGDAGAEGCRTPESAGTSALPTVEEPSADPFITGVGGTSLTHVNGTSFSGTTTTYTAPTESVWNNGAALDLAGQGGGGGGGLSSEWPMPKYQSNPLGTTTGATTTAPNNVTALDIENSESEGLEQTAGAICSGSVEKVIDDVYCREVPDVSASADPYYAYNIIYDGSLAAIGGTSGAAPLWAALMAVADSTPNCQASPIGFANPALYKIAATSAAEYARDFNDITTGNNDAYDTNGGYFSAMSGYDMASGLGTPIAANLVSDLCPAPAAETGSTTTDTVYVPTTTTETDTVDEPGSTTTVTEPAETQTETVTTGSQTETETITTPGSTQTLTTAGTSTKGSTSVINITAPTSTPAKATCAAGSTLSFVQTPKYPVVETKAVVYINGTRTKTITSRQIFVVTLKRPKANTFTLKLVTTLNDGEVLSHQITYKGCTQTHVIYTTLHKINPGFTPSVHLGTDGSSRIR